MRIDVNYGFTGDGDEDWGIAYLYLSDDEIAKFGLVPTNFNGYDNGWIQLPERDDGIKEGEHLIAAYGGILSEICMEKSVANSSDASGAYYAEPEHTNSNVEGDTAYLPDELQKNCGTQSPKNAGLIQRVILKSRFLI